MAWMKLAPMREICNYSDTLEHMPNSILSILVTVGGIFVVVMLFNFMIFVHELGHFWAARWRGLYIDRFQIWFGKPLWEKKINGVRWGIGWIPVGGFVSLPQMAPMEAIEGEADIPKNLKPISALDKIIVAAAGPLASLLLAVVFAFAVWGVGKPAVEYRTTTIGYVMPGSPAAEAGLKPGDKILEIDGQRVDRWVGDMEGVSELIMLSEREKVHFLVQRPGVDLPIELESGFEIPETKWWQRKAMRKIGIAPALSCQVASVLQGSPAERAGIKTGDVFVSLNGEKLWSPVAIEKQSVEGKTLLIGVQHPNGSSQQLEVTPLIPNNWTNHPNKRPITGIQWGESDEIRLITQHPTPWAQIGQSLKWMGDTLKKLFAPHSDVSMEHLSGPVGIASVFYDMFQAKNGWKLALWFAVVLNVNLAVLNILPLPVVDGGHVVLGITEIIMRRPVSGKFLDIVQVGFVFLLMGFFIYVTFKDIGDLFAPSDSSQQLPPPTFAALSTPVPA